MGMHSVSKIIDIKCIQLLCNIMNSDSAARSFYVMMLHKHDNMQSLLINRVKYICSKSGVNVYEVMFHEKYVNEVKKLLFKRNCHDNGLVDSISYSLKHKHDSQNASLLKLLLKAFNSIIKTFLCIHCDPHYFISFNVLVYYCNCVYYL